MNKILVPLLVCIEMGEDFECRSSWNKGIVRANLLQLLAIFLHFMSHILRLIHKGHPEFFVLKVKANIKQYTINITLHRMILGKFYSIYSMLWIDIVLFTDKFLLNVSRARIYTFSKVIYCMVLKWHLLT